ncbi:MAG TPA: carbohydrate kinase [Trebonia sp.]|jgi:fructokinase|nr:carbohydrate kinase [Trebonia sp.]
MTVQPGPPAFIVIGEALIDLLPAGDDGSYLARPGGGPMNIAVGLARLGQPAALAARLSGDLFGSILRRHLDASGVDQRYALAAPEPSTIALVELAGGQARYQFSAGGPDFRWIAGELAFLPGGARGVHFGSLASWLGPGDAAIAAAVGRLRAAGDVLVSYDPNVRPGLQPDRAAARAQVESAIARAHVVKASADDFQWLYGPAPLGPADHDAIARRWLDLGAGLVVLTAGGDGATAWTRAAVVVRRPAYPAVVADTVGAGDAFTSGLLDALARRDLLGPGPVMAGLDPDALAAVLDAAGLVAGLTCERPGASPPWRADVDARLSR